MILSGGTPSVNGLSDGLARKLQYLQNLEAASPLDWQENLAKTLDCVASIQFACIVVSLLFGLLN